MREMKTLLTFGFTMLLAFSIYAQEKPLEQKVATITMDLVPVSQIKLKKEVAPAKIARLYRRPNARVKRALTFTTVKDRPKVA